MDEIRELYDFGKLAIITEKSKLPKYALAKLSFSFAKADIENLNKRTYPESILAREIDRKSEELKTAKIAGMLDHPVSGLTQLSKSVHAISGMTYDKDSKLASAESYILDTTSGKDFMVLLNSGIKLGASMRGFGNVGRDRKIQDDYKLDTVDLVASPSFGFDAQIDASNLIESFNPEESELGEFHRKKLELEMAEGEGEKVKINERTIENALKLMYKTKVDEYGYNESYENFANQNRGIVTAEFLLQEYPDRFPTVEFALEYLGCPELDGRYHEANKEERVLEYTVEEVSSEAYAAGANPKEMCEKLNANLKISTALNNAGITARERQLMDEMREAGATDDAMELLEKCRKIQQAQKIFKPNLSEAQLLEELNKKSKEIKEARKQRIIYEIGRDISAGGGTSPEIAKAMVNKALKAEGLSLEED